jgi:hypothetical protein
MKQYEFGNTFEISNSYNIGSSLALRLHIFHLKELKSRMTAYEFYWRDKKGTDHLIGILPERRKDPERITQESILNWGRKVVGDHTAVKDISFIQVEI